MMNENGLDLCYNPTTNKQILMIFIHRGIYYVLRNAHVNFAEGVSLNKRQCFFNYLIDAVLR
jgi:hypothetical protein